MGIDNCQESQAIGRVGQISTAWRDIWTLELCAFRSPSHCFISEKRANCSTNEESSSDKDDVDISSFDRRSV